MRQRVLPLACHKYGEASMRRRHLRRGLYHQISFPFEDPFPAVPVSGADFQFVVNGQRQPLLGLARLIGKIQTRHG